MSTHGPLPGGGERLPANVGGPPPLEPKHKAVILYFMFFAEEAESHTESSKNRRALHDHAHIVASTLLKRVYCVDVHPDSIKQYYGDAVATAQAVGNWDQHAVAEIISSQVDDEVTFDEVNWFVSDLRPVSSHFPIVAHHCFASADWGFRRKVSPWLRPFS